MSTPSQPTSSGGNVFTRKLGPLPMWGWMAIALVLAIVYYAFKKHTSSSTTAQTSATDNTPGGVDSSLVPQFVNQTYVDQSPPAAPNITSNVNSNDINSNNTAPTGNTTTSTITPPAPRPPAPAPKVHYIKYTVKA